MKSAHDFAKYFLKNLDSTPNSFDGNMKLQKLLFFANLISLSEYNELLFEDSIYAFEHGCVVEDIRLRYKNDYDNFIADSLNFNPNFTDREYHILNTTNDIFANLTAQELSNLNHTFEFWKEKYDQSTDLNNFHYKDLSIISMGDMKNEVDKMKTVLSAYDLTKNNNDKTETINGVNFHYDPQLTTMNDDLISRLSEMTSKIEDQDCFVYFDDGNLVVY